jgi:ribosomal protein L37AE/L43A
MRDIIDCPDCGGQLIRESEPQDLYVCDCCELRVEDEVYTRKEIDKS